MPTWLLDKRLWIAIGVFVVIAVLVTVVILYGNSRYESGKSERDAYWKQAVIEAVNEAREQERVLAAQREQRAREAHDRELARARQLITTNTEIANAPDFETRYSAYLGHRNGLRDETRRRLDGVRADYLSSISAVPDGSAPGT